MYFKDRPETGNLIYGKLQENYVCTQLHNLTSHPISRLDFYRDNHNSTEIDFVWPFRGNLIPIEVKSQTTVNRNSLIPMVNFLEQNRQTWGIVILNGRLGTLNFRKKKFMTLPPYFVSELERLMTY